jgi:peptidoglycan LD-endopeptidase LytH
VTDRWSDSRVDFALDRETLRVLPSSPSVTVVAPTVPSRAAAASLASLALVFLAACAGHTPAPVRPTVPAPVAPAVAGADLAYLRDRALLVPVANVRARTLHGSFDDPRDGGSRTHLAIDILAPRGTPVLAADDGRIWTVRQNSLGGLTVYTVDPQDRFVFYYAHLDRYRPGIFDGMPLQKGDTLGFVGTTGNAPPNVPHLHFQVARIGPDHRWWTGTPVDPLPFLRDAEVALAGRDAGARRAATAAVSSDGRETIVVPAVRGRRAAPTVPAADTTAADTALPHLPPLR